MVTPCETWELESIEDLPELNDSKCHANRGLGSRLSSTANATRNANVRIIPRMPSHGDVRALH